MSQDEVKKLLASDPKCRNVISLNSGRRYRVSGTEKWLAGPVLVLLHGRDLVHIAYRNIASIRVVEPPRKAE